MRVASPSCELWNQMSAASSYWRVNELKQLLNLMVHSTRDVRVSQLFHYSYIIPLHEIVSSVCVVFYPRKSFYSTEQHTPTHHVIVLATLSCSTMRRTRPACPHPNN